MAMTGNSDAAVFRCLAAKKGGAEKASGEDWKKCTQTPEVKILDYGNLRTGQLVDGVDEFYKDFRNKNILVDVAMRYVKDELRGKTAKELARRTSYLPSVVQVGKGTSDSPTDALKKSLAKWVAPGMLEMSVNLTAPAVLFLVGGLYLIILGLTSDILISESDVPIREEDLADAKATPFRRLIVTGAGLVGTLYGLYLLFH